MKLTKELFVIPSGDNYMLYAPLKGSVLEVNGATLLLLKKINSGIKVEASEALDDLVSLRIVGNSKEVSLPELNLDPSKESRIAIIPTTDCDLKCVYCYSSAGERIVSLEPRVSKKAIDFAFANAKEKELDGIEVSFLGGGDPLGSTGFELVKDIIGYAQFLEKRAGLKPKFYAQTNGLLSVTNLEWLIENFEHLIISFDGPPEFQNTQRPLKNGKPSFEYVDRTLKFLDEREFDYAIRCTISDRSVKKMPEVLAFIKQRYPNLRSLDFEPVKVCGRCISTNTSAPDLEDFLNGLNDANTKAEEVGLNLGSTFNNVFILSNTYCGAAGANFILTPYGTITSCVEVLSEEDELGKVFIQGRYDRVTDSFVFYEDRQRNLRRRTVDNMEDCIDCFAKYVCSGGCMVHMERQGSMFEVKDREYCDMRKGELVKRLKQSLEV
jgi:uncharacterized protein